MSDEPTPMIGEEELSRAQRTLNDIIMRHQGRGGEGIEAGFRECNIDPSAANDLITKYYLKSPRWLEHESFCAGILHGLQVGALAAAFIADSYIIDVRTEDEKSDEH